MTGQRTLSKLMVLQGESDATQVDDVTSVGDGRGSGARGARSQRESMLATAARWLAALPNEEDFSSLTKDRSADVAASPVERALAREISKGRAALKQVREDLLLLRYWNNI